MDPVTLSAVALAGTAVGGGISAYGAYTGGQQTKEYYDLLARNDLTQANIARLKAGRDIMAGDVEAQKYGIATAQRLGGTIARAGAGNVGPTTGSTAQVYQSQRAAGLEEQQIARQTAGERAYGEDVEAAAKVAGAGAEQFAGQRAAFAGEVGAAADVAGTVGKMASMGLEAQKFAPTAVGTAQPVDSKWYQGLDLMSGDSGPTTGPPLNLIG
jgi:hypothetical protein